MKYIEWIHTLCIHTLTLTYEFKSFVAPLDHMNSYHSSMIWIHTILYHMNSYLSSMIWIHIRMLQSIPNTRTILQTALSIPENCIVTSVNNLLHLTSDLNSWMSKMVITHRDQSLDISSAAQGSLSSTPIGVIPLQNIPYPCTKYCFDEKKIGCDAKDFLVKMLRSPKYIELQVCVCATTN